MASLSVLAALHGSNLAGVASAAGVSPVYLRNVELGRQALTLVTAKKISLRLGVPITDVISAAPRTVDGQALVPPKSEELLTRPLRPPPGVPVDYAPIQRAQEQPAIVTAGNRTYVHFRGGDRHALVGDVLDLQRTDTFSFVVWVRYLDPGSYMGIIEKMRDFANGNRGYDFHVNPLGQFGFNLNNNIGGGNFLAVAAVGNFGNLQWHQCVVTYDGSSSAAGVRFYVDRVLRTRLTFTDNLTSSITHNDPFALGRRQNSNPDIPYVGDMDEVAVYDRVLSQSEVEELYAGGIAIDYRTIASSAGSLLAYWRMGEGASYPVIPDLIASNNAVLANMTPEDIVMAT